MGGQRGHTGHDCSSSSTILSGYSPTAGTAAVAEAALSLSGPFRGTGVCGSDTVVLLRTFRTFFGRPIHRAPFQSVRHTLPPPSHPSYLAPIRAILQKHSRLSRHLRE